MLPFIAGLFIGLICGFFIALFFEGMDKFYDE